MRIITFILIFSFFSCNTQEKNENDSISSKDEIVIENESVPDYIDSARANSLDEVNTNTHLNLDSIGIEENTPKKQTTFCPKIIQYLEEVNWRKHPIDNCYVVDLPDGVSLSSFVESLHHLGSCSNQWTKSNILNTFGRYASKKNTKKGLFYNYPIVQSELVPCAKQQQWNFHVFKDLGSMYFKLPKVVLNTVPADEMIDD